MSWGHTLRGLALLIHAQLLRIAREGLVVRALIWPGLLTALTLVISSAVVLSFYSDDEVLLQPGHEQVAEQLDQAGLTVLVDPDPSASLGERAPRAAWMDGGQWHLSTTRAGRLSLATEAILRKDSQASWRIIAPAPSGRQVELGATVRILVGMLGVLFALYGVVFGAAALARDRADGSLEADLALPLPRALHALARVLSSGLALAAGIGLTVSLLDALIGVDHPLQWAVAVTLGGTTCTAMGLGWMASTKGESLTGPLSRGMTVALAAIWAGFSWPEFGQHLPLSSLGAMVRDQPPSALAWGFCALSIALSAVVFSRRLS